MNISDYHDEVDKTLDRWVDQAKANDMPIACFNCKKPSCCRQRVMAYDQEITLIALHVGLEKPHLKVKVRKWVNDFLRLKSKEQVATETPFHRNMWCPFFENGKCGIYEVRPLVCRSHFALEEDEGPCNDPETKSVRLMNTAAIHEFPMRAGMVPYLMPLGVASILFGEQRIGKRAFKKMLWLRKKWTEGIAKVAAGDQDIEQFLQEGE